MPRAALNCSRPDQVARICGLSRRRLSRNRPRRAGRGTALQPAEDSPGRSRPLDQRQHPVSGFRGPTRVALHDAAAARKTADRATVAAPEQAPQVNPRPALCGCGRCGGYSGGGRLAFSNVTTTDVVGGIWAPGGKF